MLRPDEIATASKVHGQRELDKTLKRGVKSAIGFGIGAATSLGSRLAPFLNDLIPTDLAVKGINKISPKVGAFLQKGISQGLDVKEGLEFVKNNLAKEENKPPKENRNIIEQYSPELNQFIKDEIGKGRNPLEAAAVASLDEKFKKIIRKMEQDHSTPFSALLQTVFGNAGNVASQQVPVGRTAEQAMYSTPEGRKQQAGLPPQFQQALDKIMSM